MGLELFQDGGAPWPGVKGRKKRFKGRGRSLREQGFRQPALKARLRGSQRGVVLELPLYACLPREACLQHIVLSPAARFKGTERLGFQLGEHRLLACEELALFLAPGNIDEPVPQRRAQFEGY